MSICSTTGVQLDRVKSVSLLFRSVGHRVKTHKVTPVVNNEHGDIEIKDYVILSLGEDNRIPPLTLMMDVTMTHDHYGRTTQCTNGTLTHDVLHWISSDWRNFEQWGHYLQLCGDKTWPNHISTGRREHFGSCLSVLTWSDLSVCFSWMCIVTLVELPSLLDLLVQKYKYWRKCVRTQLYVFLRSSSTRGIWSVSLSTSFTLDESSGFRIDFGHIFRTEGYYSHRFVYYGRDKTRVKLPLERNLSSNASVQF